MVFIPFVITTFVIAKDSVRIVKKKDIETGAMLSECVINIKIIFSFNFQQSVIGMYQGLLLDENTQYIKVSLWKGTF